MINTSLNPARRSVSGEIIKKIRTQFRIKYIFPLVSSSLRNIYVIRISMLYPLRNRRGTYLRCCSQGGRSS